MNRSVRCLRRERKAEIFENFEHAVVRDEKVCAEILDPMRTRSRGQELEQLCADALIVATSAVRPLNALAWPAAP